MSSTADARTRLLAAVEAIAPRLEAGVAESEAAKGPTRDVVDAMREAGLMALKAPRELGGDEADWTLQTEVFEKVAYHNLSAAWCLMLYADNTGKAAASLTEAGLARLMPDGVIPAVCGGGGLMMGDLTPVEGGFRLTGRWIYGSGIPQADFVLMSARTAADADGRFKVYQCVVPTSDIEIVDNWNVMGLKGTGSADFLAHDIFLPAEMAFEAQAPVQRGGVLFRLSTFGYAGLCMPAVMIGAARRALDDLARLAESKSRGYMNKTTLANRGVFQKFLGEADMKLKAARALSIATGEKLLRDAEALGKSPEANEAEARAVGVFCSDTAISVINGVVGYAGGEGVRAGHLFERTLRDLHMAGTHMFVSDIAYENHAHFLLGRADARLSA